MSEESPHSIEENYPTKPLPGKIDRPKAPLSKGACAGIGVALYLGSIPFLIFFQPIALMALIAAFLSLFFEGYRYIFVGYILSLLIVVGLLFLAVIVICGSGSNHM